MGTLASHQCGPGSNPGVDAIFGLSLLLVLSLGPRGFSPGIPVWPSPQKPTLPNSNSTRNQVDEEPLCGCATSKSLFIYFIHLNGRHTLTKNLNNIANLRFPVIGPMRTISIWNFTCKICALPTYQEIPEIPRGV